VNQLTLEKDALVAECEEEIQSLNDEFNIEAVRDERLECIDDIAAV